MNAHELLLAGRPTDALRAADLQLAASDRSPDGAGEFSRSPDGAGEFPSDPAAVRDAKVARVRALVALGRPREAASQCRELTGDHVAERIARALACWAAGEPARARLMLWDAPTDGPERQLLLWTLAELTRSAGDVGAAVTLAGQAHAEAERSGEPRWKALTELLLGRCLSDAGDLALGGAVIDRALAHHRLHLAGTVALAEALDAAGSSARKRGHPADAVALHREALGLWQDELGPDGAHLAGCRYALAQALHRTGDTPGALTEMRAAWELTERAWGADHVDTWITAFEVGRLEVDSGEMLDGFPRMEAARSEVLRRLGAQHPVVRSMDRLLPRPSRRR